MKKYSNENLLNRIFSIIEYMSEQRRYLSIQEISQDLDIATATVHRILTGLKDLGYIGQSTDKSYFLTYKLFEVSGKVMERDNFAENLIPYMNYFVRKYDCDVGLSVFNDENVIHLMTIGNNKSFRSSLFTPGSIQPAYCTGTGKVFLSYMDEPTLTKWLEAKRLIPYTSNTIIDPNVLKNEIIKTRKVGYGTSVGEYIESICCVAFPIADKDCKVKGTINFSVSSESFSEFVTEQFIADVKSVLADISKLNI